MSPGSARTNALILFAPLLGLVIGLVVYKFFPRNQEDPQPAPPARESSKVFRPRDIAAVIDPQNDGWQSEVFAEAAKAQLDRLAQALAEGQPRSALELIASASVECSELYPNSPEVVFEADGVEVRRGSPPADLVHRGRDNVAAALGKLSDAAEHFALKIHQVALSEDGAETAVTYEATASGLQQTAHWRCMWSADGGRQPSLLSLRLLDFEEVRDRRGSWFTDQTEAVLGQNASFHEQLSHGLHHWLGRIGRAHGMSYFKRHGLAVGDANGDGLDDLYLCAAGGLPNRLFVQSGDGSAKDSSGEFGVDYLDETSSALFIDLDNDGDQDLALATFEGVQVLENRGNRGFRHRASLRMIDTDLGSLSAADFDNDADLDLYITVDFAEKGAHLRRGTELPGFVYHDANDGGRNVLFRNDGSWAFKDVTGEVGLEVHNRRHSLAAAWEDYDRDGDQDLYVANDYGQNCLYRNDRDDGSSAHRFVEVAPSLGIVDYGSGMSVSWGDYDRDGLSDLYVGNMFSYAGNRIARQDKFLPDGNEKQRALNLRFAKGNSLYRGLPGGRFEESGGEAGVEMGRWAWSSLFVDLNNDGWQDLFVANGYLTTPETKDL